MDHNYLFPDTQYFGYMFYMYVSIRYQYNASGMCENPGSVLKQHHIQRITVNLKLTFYRKSYMKVFATTDVALR